MAFTTQLPPDCVADELDPNMIVRIVNHYKYAKDEFGQLVSTYELDKDGKPIVDWVERRPITDDLEEARTKRIDYWHPKFGWIREGYKLERDRDAQSIMQA